MNATRLIDELFIGGATTEIKEIVYEAQEAIPKQQNCRSLLRLLVVEGAPSVFVPIRVHSWFVLKSSGDFSLKDLPGRALATTSSRKPCIRSWCDPFQ